MEDRFSAFLSKTTDDLGVQLENLEQYWEQSFSPIGRKFTEIRPNYQDMGETDSNE